MNTLTSKDKHAEREQVERKINKRNRVLANENDQAKTN